MQSSTQLEFTKLLSKSRPAIFSIITQMPIDGAHYDDLFQEISFRAWRSYEGFKGEATFTTWICAITKYTAIDILRKQKKHNDLLNQYEIYCTLNQQLFDEPYSEIPLPSISCLSESEKRLFNMRIKGLSFKRISLLTNIPENRLRVHMHRIKQKIYKAAMLN